MNDSCSSIVIFPGTFDPVTNGHLDVIRRGSRLFDQLVVAVGDNPEKRSLLEQAERAEILREVVRDLPNVRVEVYTGLTAALVRRLGATAILRGIRDAADLQIELQMAFTNRAVVGVETLFLMSSEQYAFTSSSLIRQIAAMGGDISSLVPPEAMERIRAKAARGKGAP